MIENDYRNQHNRRQLSANPYKAISAGIKVIMLAILFFTAITSKAQQGTTDAKQLNLDKGVAISGYDPVAYFTLSKAVAGKSNINYMLNGATYYFATEANRSMFIKEPGKYEPQYGGWCAYAMATKGEKVEIDPQTFKIVNGKLLLFYNRFFNNTLTSWNKNEKAFLPQADANWAQTSKK